MFEPQMRDAKAEKVRTSVTICSADHEELERIAEQKKVSVAWVIREAIERYLAHTAPLFKRPPH